MGSTSPDLIPFTTGFSGSSSLRLEWDTGSQAEQLMQYLHLHANVILRRARGILVRRGLLSCINARQQFRGWHQYVAARERRRRKERASRIMQRVMLKATQHGIIAANAAFLRKFAGSCGSASTAICNAASVTGARGQRSGDYRSRCIIQPFAYSVRCEHGL